MLEASAQLHSKAELITLVLSGVPHSDVLLNNVKTARTIGTKGVRFA
jgi:hypothetical protein